MQRTSCYDPGCSGVGVCGVEGSERGREEGGGGGCGEGGGGVSRYGGLGREGCSDLFTAPV